MSEAKTKRAHFVPASYLQYWSATGSPDGRKSTLYWTNGEKSGAASAERLAHQKFLYSKSDPNSAEKFFQEFENDWVKFVDRLIEGKLPRAEVSHASFLLQCGFLLLRNPKLGNQAATERIHTYKSAIEVFFKAVLLDQIVPNTREGMLSRINELWEMRFVEAVGEPWITSDNPVLTLAHAEMSPAIIYIPITPKFSFVALRSSVFAFSSSTLSGEDCRNLNSYTATNSNRQIYSSTPFEDSDVSSFKKWLDRRPNSENYIDHESISLQSFNYPVLGMNLSVLESTSS